jgi:GTPase
MDHADTDTTAGTTADDEGASRRVPVVVVVGRPNVGKSTLFNRIVGEQAAIVEDRPGITRDRKELEAEWLGVPFMIVDTGGWMPGGDDLDAKVSHQVEVAVADADLVLFVVDAAVGVVTEDTAIAQWLRRAGPPVMVVANKADNDQRERELWDFLALGLGDATPVSALHGRRAGDLLDVVLERLGDAAVVPDEPTAPWLRDADDAETESAADGAPRVAIVGRPNVGKSTLFNRLVGEDRSVVHDMSGTTRDAVDTLVETEDGPIVFVDTAGMRRRSKIDDSAEYYSMVRALRAIDDADIALLVIDARTSASPSGSTPPAARSSCCSTNGRRSTTPRSGPSAGPMSPANCRSSARPRSSRSRRSPARACTSCARCSPRPSSSTTGVCPPVTSTG